MSSSSGDEPVPNQYTPPLPAFSISFRLPGSWDSARTRVRIGFATVRVNGTVVLNFIGPAALFSWRLFRSFRFFVQAQIGLIAAIIS
jgi:hypothetical protein